MLALVGLGKGPKHGLYIVTLRMMVVSSFSFWEGASDCSVPGTVRML